MQNYNKKNINQKYSKKRSSRKGCILGFLVAFIIALCVLLLSAGIIALYYYRTIPKLENLTPSLIAETSKVYAIDGSLLTEFHATENREIITFDMMSDNIKNAVIAVEDKRFYIHQGVDYKRILGALINDIMTKNYSQGASTITQQYVKNVYFSQEKTLRRKINEALVAIQIERNYTKDKILEMYLNTVNFGAGAYGIEKAAQTYFGISAKELSIPQSALLAGLLKAPEVYSPFNNMENATNRRSVVLNLMKEQGFITEDQYNDAVEDPVVLNTSFNPSGTEENRFAPFFIDFVKQQLYDKKFTDFDVFKGGLRIYTTLDKELQVKAENSFKKVFTKPIGPSYSLISVDSNNGYIYAIVGGKDYAESKFNIATQGKRQPGSVFKVPVLLESIIKNIPPETTFDPNGPISIDIPGSKPWKVNNYGGEKFSEPLNPMNLIDATIHSVNVVYAQLIMKIGAKNVEALLNNMNIFDIGSNPAIALGGLEKGITPLDVSKIFSTIASGGVYHEPVCILKITDSSGNILFEYDPENSPLTKRVFEEPQAFLATQILQRVITEGTGKAAGIGRPAAGKTGTTSDLRDAWFAGYTPELTTIVWMGYQESNKAMEPINKKNVTGGAFPAQIWSVFMKEALKGKPIVQFTAPENSLTEIQVCKDSEMLPTYWCPAESLEPRMFVKGMAPTKYCNIHNKVTVPDLTGMTADEARQILSGLFFNINESVEQNSDYESGTVFRTDPPGNTVLEIADNINPQITIFISQGRQAMKMPNLTGQTKNSAENILAESGLSISNVIYDYSSQPADIIFNQEPAPDTDIDPGSPITIYISKGINPSGSIPNVTGMSKQDAISTLNNSGFSNISLVEEQNIAAINTVFSQNPAAGTGMEKSKQVILSISKGVKVPSVTGLLKDDAVKLILSSGFTAEILPSAEYAGKVISQSPAPDTFASSGSKIIITIEDTAATSTTDMTSTTSPSSSSSSSSSTSSTSASTTTSSASASSTTAASTSSTSP